MTRTHLSGCYKYICFSLTAFGTFAFIFRVVLRRVGIYVLHFYRTSLYLQKFSDTWISKETSLRSKIVAASINCHSFRRISFLTPVTSPSILKDTFTLNALYSPAPNNPYSLSTGLKSTTAAHHSSPLPSIVSLYTHSTKGTDHQTLVLSCHATQTWDRRHPQPHRIDSYFRSTLTPIYSIPLPYLLLGLMFLLHLWTVHVVPRILVYPVSTRDCGFLVPSTTKNLTTCNDRK